LRYSIDTSSIVHAWCRAYAPSNFPSVWEKIDGLIRRGDLRATEEVLVDLEAKLDELYKWAHARKQILFICTDEKMQEAVREIMQRYPRLVDVRTGRSIADPFVIALARIENCTLVTEERPTGKLDRPNIPDVCVAMGIPCINVLQLIAEQGWKF